MNILLSYLKNPLQKALQNEPDHFTKSRVTILYTMLLFSMAKGLIVIAFSIINNQPTQIIRAAIATAIYILLTTLLLRKSSSLKFIAHVMVWVGIGIIWSSIFFFAQKINLVALQFLFMVILGSFYTLGSRLGIFYSIFSTVPLIILFLSGGDSGIYMNTDKFQQLASPGYEILVILNFVTIIVCHYLFYDAFLHNIEEKEKLNKQLQSSIIEANKLAATKSNFLSTMSHELRTPLNSVIGITEILLEDKPEERQKENLKILQLSANDLLSLINNVLDFNKIDSDKLVLEKTTFGLTEFMQNISTSLRLKANDKKLNFVLDIDNQLDKTWVISDPTRLSQLMYNLVGNAIKFTEHGSICVKLTCIHKTNTKADVQFSITDTGIGIHPDKHNAIFESFTQAESHTTRKYGGTGLGLAIVKQILTLFNSELELESSLGIGSKFSFNISFSIANEQAPVITAAHTDKPDYSHLNILIAEDNDVNRLLMQKQLERQNIKATLVDNGQLAYEACMNNDYDAILMDLHMPVLNGYEATRKIRSLADNRKAGIYIIAFTASVTEQQEIFNSGFNDFLYKPVNMNELNNKLENIAISKQLRS